MKLYILIALLLASMHASAGDIAFTFDDAPTGDSSVMTGEERTTAIIKGLKSSGVQDALFFVTTNNINDLGPDRLKRYVQAGYHLGNHSHLHKSANKIAPNDFMVDIYRAHLTLKEYGNTLPYFRFPYLHYGKNHESMTKIQGLLSELGYRNGYVTIDNFDWYINSALNKAKEAGKTVDYEKLGDLYVAVIWQGIEFYDAIAKKTLGRSPKHVLLLHENDTSALFLPKLVKHIKAKGWNIISPQQAYEDAIAETLPNVLFHKQGRVAALAKEKGMNEKGLRHESENVEYLDALFKRNKVFELQK